MRFPLASENSAEGQDLLRTDTSTQLAFISEQSPTFNSESYIQGVTHLGGALCVGLHTREIFLVADTKHWK